MILNLFSSTYLFYTVPRKLSDDISISICYNMKDTASLDLMLFDSIFW